MFNVYMFNVTSMGHLRTCHSVKVLNKDLKLKLPCSGKYKKTKKVFEKALTKAQRSENG